MADGYGFGNEYRVNENNVTKVNVEGITGNALSGIMKALDKQARLMDQLRRGIEEAGDELGTLGGDLDDIESLNRKRAEDDRKEKKSEITRSVASERRQRAANQAVFGKIDKGIGVIGVLKDTLSSVLGKIKDLIADGLRRSLKAFSDLSASMRLNYLTKEQKHMIGTAARDATGDQNMFKESTGINVSSGDANAAMESLFTLGKSINNLSEMQKDAYTAFISLNMDKEEAYIKATTLSQEQISKEILARSDYQVKGVIEGIYAKTTSNERNKYYGSGDADKASAEILSAAKSFSKEVGGIFDNDALATVSKMFLDLKHGNIAGDSQLGTAALAVFGNKIENIQTATTEQMAEALKDTFIEAAGDKDKLAELENQLVILQKNGVVDSKLLDQVRNGIDMAKAEVKRAETEKTAPDFKVLGRDVREDEIKDEEGNIIGGNKGALADSSKEGLAFQWLDNLTAKFDTLTGGALTDFSNGLDTYFGSALPIEEIVSHGFKTVCTLLFTMVASDFIKKGFSALKGILTSALGALGIGKGASDLADTIDDLTDAADDLSDTSKKGKAADAAKNAKKTPTVKGKGKLGRIGNAFSKTKTALGSGLGKIAVFLKNGWGKAKGFFGKAISKVGSLLSAINPFKGGAGGFLSNIFSKLGGFFKAALSKAGPAILKLFTSIGPKVLSVFSKLLGPIGWAITAVQGGFSLGEVIANKLLPDGVKLVEKAGGYINSIKQIGQFIATETSEFFTYKVKPMLKSIGEFFSSVAKSIGNFFTNTIPKFFTETAPNAISSLANSIGDFFSNAISNIEDYFYKDFVTPVSDFFKDIYKSADEYFISPISNFFEDAKEFAKNNFIDPLKKFFDFDWAPKLIRNFVKNGTISKEDVLDLLPDMPDSFKNVTNRLSETVGSLGRFVGFYAEGGVVNKATPAVVGEDGKEAILPLEKPGALRNVLSKLTSIEKQTLIKELLGSKSFTVDTFKEILTNIVTKGVSPTGGQSVLDQLPKDGVPGDDQATINRILSYAGPYAGLVYNLMLHGKNGKYKNAFNQRKKWYEEAKANAANQEGRDLIRGTYAERALDYGVSELGKPYILRSLGKIGYVCNELVNACISASGFNMGKFRVHGVKATFANIQKGKYSGNEYPNFRIRDDLTPETAMPGMVFFQDARKNREGGFQPGHIGLVYYGHQKLHSSGGSSNYTKEGFLPNWQTPCRGVTVTPFDNSNYVIGEFPGLFEKATNDWKLPKDTPIPFGPSYTSTSGAGMNSETAVKKAGLLTDEELNNLAKEAGVNNAATLKEFIKQAEFVMNSNKDKDSIITILLDIAKYLRGAVTSSKPTVPVARPVATVYG